MDSLHPTPFGSCCQALHDAMHTARSFLFVENDVLFLTVARTRTGRPRFYDQAVFYCPFCGQQLQTAEDVAKKLAAGEQGNGSR